MEKEDRRITRTRKMLGEALVDLMLEQGYDNFSVKDLTERANIGYATFYRHFKRVDELLAYVMASMIDGHKKAVAGSESPRDEAVKLYRYYTDNPLVCRAFLGLPESNHARQLVRDNLADMLHERFLPRDESIIPLEVAVHQFVQSSLDLMRWYLENMDVYSPEQVAEIHIDLVIRNTTSLSFEPRAVWLESFPPRQLDVESHAIAESPGASN